MGYTFCVYENTGEVHIVDDRGNALCRLIKVNSNCKEIGIWKIKYFDKQGTPWLDIIKKLVNLSECEALAVAHSLQVLGINICGDCVKSLYKNN